MADEQIYLRVKSGIEREQVSARQGGRAPRYRPVVWMFETTDTDPDTPIPGTESYTKGSWYDTEAEAEIIVDSLAKNMRAGAIQRGGVVHNRPLSERDKQYAPRPEVMGF